jgi:hypothetical protein
MQRQRSAGLVLAIALAVVSTLQQSAAALTVTPDRVACTFGSTLVIDALANDASDASTLKFKKLIIGGAFVLGSLSTVTCGEPPHDCIQY